MALGARLPNGLVDFGTRSLITHAIMAVGFTGAVISGLIVEGRVGVILLVAFMNFTAGVWICQSVHSLGNTLRDEDYDGVLTELRARV